jgi:hypothetical protein
MMGLGFGLGGITDAVMMVAPPKQSSARGRFDSRWQRGGSFESRL